MKVRILIKKALLWVLAFLITIGAVVYQRMTGPTYPLDLKFSVDAESYKISLPRSHGEKTDCLVEIALPYDFSGEVVYRRYPTNQSWDTIRLHRIDNNLVAFLPQQPPAGKLEYHVNLRKNGTDIDLGLEENILIKFKGNVPNWALIPHVLILFLAMLWSNATGLQAAANIKSYRRNAVVTLTLLVIGGVILGPIVQKFAFGTYWPGWPFGEDLTDIKVLVSVIIWLAAVMPDRKKERKWLIIVAALFLFAIYMIPNSMQGTELDFESGQMITGIAALLLIQKRSICRDWICIK